ncbi:penicillin-binding transpeptidase domain-containing protein [Corynebacterium sp.]|uniref:penicillin-binding transpeptidase domain-containing protein n=1 Tax=Corynebacterium sp. TaxID=1720 RepID=UPI0026DCC010|nr:penicillin-binding transpeptidase domain-containing protein [Corynebacterium sp.]MDO5077649.1 penicillin-binding transpeptidase domain-containing protein [Corynebacterium sp.]
MNKSIRNAAVFSLLLIVVLLANLSWIQVFQEEKYAHNSYNRRQFFELKSTPRGQISAGGLVLARSNKDEDGYYHREYVTNPIAYGPIEGYISDVYGASGIEQSYNDILNGTDTSLISTQWWDAITGKEASGASIELTIDPAMQDVAYNELASRNYLGAVVALRPSTGEVLAMASTPSYDPAPIVDPATAESTWAQLTQDPESPLLNHATQETLPPGSTFKVITTAAALQGDYTPNSQVTAASEITLPGTNTTLENYGGQSCGSGATTTLIDAFAKSCNTAFVEMGVAIGADALTSTAQAFGLEDSYDLGLPVEKGRVGDLSDDAARGQSSIGQRDVSMSVLHNAVVAATVANGGMRMQPFVVKRILRSDLSELRATKTKELGQAIPTEVAGQLTEMMRSSERAMPGGTNHLASKTGTAEHGEDSRNSNPHAWYIAFNPDADVAVAVVVKNGGDRGQAATGGSVAAPIGHAVLNAAQRQ